MEEPLHPQSSILVKDNIAIRCDTAIVPLITWLNSFDGIATQWSCQGEPGGSYSPYFMLLVSNLDSFNQILIVMDSFREANPTYGYPQFDVWYRRGETKFNFNFNKLVPADKSVSGCEIMQQFQEYATRGILNI